MKMKTYRYITLYFDIRVYSEVCELVHYASSLPQAIKDGRAYVRDLNRSESRIHGMKLYRYDQTYRAR